jgi:hypothetical protein
MVWGWFVASLFILCIGISMAELASAASTSGGGPISPSSFRTYRPRCVWLYFGPLHSLLRGYNLKNVPARVVGCGFSPPTLSHGINSLILTNLQMRIALDPYPRSLD